MTNIAEPQVILREWLRSLTDSDGASTLVPKVSDDVMQALSAILITNQLVKYEVKVDAADATTTYIGKAAPGTATGVEEWQISRIDTSVLAADILYADGDYNFDNEWDERAGLSYGP